MAKEAATIELIWDLMRGRTDGISRVDYVPQKPAFPEELPYEQPFSRTSPESQESTPGRSRSFSGHLKPPKSFICIM
ncbi:MAG: hypothetical protein ACLR6B_14250 [Blautia sp.]